MDESALRSNIVFEDWNIVSYSNDCIAQLVQLYWVKLEDGQNKEGILSLTRTVRIQYQLQVSCNRPRKMLHHP